MTHPHSTTENCLGNGYIGGMRVGSKKYGLQWVIDAGDPWRVLYRGDSADWVHCTREDLKILYKKFGSLDVMNDWIASQISSERYCVVKEEKISEIEV